MPTLVDIEGFEHQVKVSNATTTMNPKLWDTSTDTPGNITFVTGRSGIGKAFHMEPDGTNNLRLGRLVTTAGTLFVASFYVRWVKSPTSGRSRFFTFTSDIASFIALNTDGTIAAGVGTGTARAGPSMLDGLWHRIDCRSDTSPATHTLDWSVDGAAQTQATGAGVAASNMTRWDLGSTAAADNSWVEVDDIVISATTGDYPIGKHTVYAKVPSADVNYTNVGTNTMERASDGADISASVPAWSMLNTWPPPQGAVNGTTVTSSTSDATKFVEVSFAARPSWATSTAWGVRGLVAHWSDTTGANTGISRITDSAGTTLTDIYSGDMSETSQHYTAKIITAPAGGWTTTNLDGAHGRLGFGTLQPGAPEWLALMLQVATPDTLTLQGVDSTTTVTAAAPKTAGKPIPATNALGAAVAKAPTKFVPAATTATVGRSSRVTKFIPAAFTGTVAIATQKVLNAAIAATTALTAVVVRRTAHTVAAAVTFMADVFQGVSTGVQLFFRVGKPIAAATTVTASVRGILAKLIATTVTVTAALTRLIPRTIAATTTITAALVRLTAKTIAAATTLTAVLARLVGKPIAATLTLTPTVLRLIVGKLIAAGTTVGAVVDHVFEAGSHSVQQAIDATTTLAVAITRRTTKAVAATVTFMADVFQGVSTGVQVFFRVGKPVSATTTVTATTLLGVTFAKLVAAVTTITAALARLKAVSQAIAAATTLGVSLKRNVGKLVTATTALAAVLARRVGKPIAGVTTLGAALTRRTGTLVATTATLGVDLTRRIAYRVAATVTMDPVVAVLRVFRRTIAAGTAVTASVTATYQAVRLQAVAATTTLAAGISRRTAKAVAATTALGVTLGRTINHVVAVAVSATFDAVVVRGIGKVLDLGLVVAVEVNRGITKTIGVLLDMGARLKRISSNLAHGFAISGPTAADGTEASSADTDGDARGADTAGSTDATTTGGDPWGSDTGEGR